MSENMHTLNWWLEHGDAVEVLRQMPDCSVDALVTDPPAGISFMDREWDNDKGGRDQWIAWLRGVLEECRRVMKPGTYGWVWALPRTSHWTATACEDAGFAVRDVLMHAFGTGFPKSRALLKPAGEHWILIKAPGELCELRIEENRIGVEARSNPPKGKPSAGWGHQNKGEPRECTGRWPANFALSHNDDCVLVGEKKVKTSDPRRADGSVNCGLGTTGIYGGVADPEAKMDKPRYCDADGTETIEAWQCSTGCAVKTLDEQSRHLHRAGAAQPPQAKWANQQNKVYGDGVGSGPNGARFGDAGTASRFFYVAKPSTRERSAGLPEGARNVHTTVKSTKLMEHLVSLIAAPGDLVLDPFTGSGTTGIAALRQRCRFVGIEKEAEYVEIARQRVAHAAAEMLRSPVEAVVAATKPAKTVKSRKPRQPKAASAAPATISVVTFSYTPQGTAPRSVHVAGSFNGWPQTVAAGGWPLEWDEATRTFKLERVVAPGTYTYKLVLDEREWIAHPGSLKIEADGLGGYSSVLEVAA